MTTAESVHAMRSPMRFVATLLGLVALYAVYEAAKGLVGANDFSLPVSVCLLVTAAGAFVQAYLAWQQVEPATRFVNEPTQSRLGDLTRAMRRFWRLSGFVAVLQLTALLAGFALHGGM